PREPLSLLDQDAPHRTVQGDVHWRLISYLALSHFGIEDRQGGTSAAALRELLSLFADLSEATDEKQINGITALDTRPITRLIRREDGHFPARGVEVKITLDEDAFEGTGAILMGAILDRFLAEYAPVNSFTQTVIATQQRGVIKQWPPRTGSGPLL
ncbi:MAG: type VI secretion system baseplate subunit TssF, partial [Pseudomonadota bacterium]